MTTKRGGAMPRLVAAATALAAVAAAVAAALTVAAAPSSAAASPGRATVSKSLAAAVRGLPVSSESAAGYDRDLFRHWVDADGDCRDTRDEVLAAESRTRVSGCDITTGTWFSYYDHETWASSSDVDIDHLVPLKEAWDSGAKHWDATTRERYANDLGDPRTLVAVTDNVNQSKSDQDVADWLPKFNHCRYVTEWTAVKVRWHLNVDRREKQALTRLAAHCPGKQVRVTTATVVRGGSSGGSGGSGTGGGGTDPRFSYCYQAIAAGYGPYYRGRDPEYAWYEDADHDGIVCE
ncbi:DUF1524 domain-containing protein [Nocardioides sp. CN2-186]|uniref:GmrSD restriction endonuclease domain-containing protein n=1 Tax=Nocardioides tweenelious TaxID=3156607 RepID=UPI0032B3F546